MICSYPFMRCSPAIPCDDAIHCNTLQYLQYFAIRCNTLQYFAIFCNTLRTILCNIFHCIVTMQNMAIHCNRLKYFAICCNTLLFCNLQYVVTMQYIAILCNTLHCIATMPTCHEKLFWILNRDHFLKLKNIHVCFWWEIQRNVCQKFNSEWFMILQYRPFLRCFPAINKLHWDDADLWCKTVLGLDFIFWFYTSLITDHVW